MKRILILFVFALASLVQANAQVAPDLKYKDLKDIYNPKLYVHQMGDPYSRALPGIASLLIPGLGQVIDGEYVRGIAFCAGNIVLNLAADSFGKKFEAAVTTDSNGNITGYKDEEAANLYRKLYLLTLAVGITENVWACVDAIKIAKVKNMYYQDLTGRKAVIDMSVNPYFAFTPTEMTASGNSLQPTAGMSLRVSF